METLLAGGDKLNAFNELKVGTNQRPYQAKLQKRKDNIYKQRVVAIKYVQEGKGNPAAGATPSEAMESLRSLRTVEESN
jgi:hypothetical protein